MRPTRMDESAEPPERGRSRPVVRPDEHDPRTGRRFLREEAYADDTHLAKRRAIWSYREPPVDLPAWALGLVELTGREAVLDAGCGPGTYLARLRAAGHTGTLVGLDLSAGMAAAAAAHGPAVVGDTAALPFSDERFDLVLAMHTLYHLPDIPAGISELRRVLRQGGAAIVATNGAGHVAELARLPVEAVRRLYGVDLPNSMAAWRFRLEDAPALLAASFSRVDRHDVPGRLRVPDADAVVAYVDSMQGFQEGVPAYVEWGRVLEEVRRLVTREIDAHGAFRATASVGCLVCS